MMLRTYIRIATDAVMCKSGVGVRLRANKTTGSIRNGGCIGEKMELNTVTVGRNNQTRNSNFGEDG